MRDLASELARARVSGQRFQRARVTAVSGNTLTVKLADADDPITCLALLGPAYAVNDTVVVARDGTSSFVLGRMAASAPAADPDPEPPPPVAVSRVTRTILPQSTGTYRSSGGWRSGDEMRQGDWNSGYGLNLGAAFYGRQLRSLDADTGRSRSATLYYRRTDGGVYGGQTPTIWTLSQSKRPSGAPTRLSSSAGASVAVGRAASWSVPTSMLDALLSGAAGGLGIYVGSASPYIVLDGRGDYGKAFALSVTYYPNS